MSTTNVPTVQFTDTGLIVPQESDILSGVMQDYNDAFGGNLNTNLETPQGQLASSTSAIIAACNALFAYFVNQINPDTNSGFMQDGIGRIYFLERSPGVPTNVSCVCMGAFGTIIPVGAQAQDTSGNLYICTDGGAIPVGGTVTLNFANIVEGPVPCPANTLTTIYRAIPGWDSINNPADGVIGRNIESRAEFEFRRKNSVALNAHGSLDSVYAAVFDVADVLDVYATENVTDGIITVGATSYPLAPHSLYIAVTGGLGQSVGNAIWTKKDVGCNMNGNTTVTVFDTNYQPPIPYTITFERPIDLPIKFAVQIASSASLPTNIVALTKAAIIASFIGADGSQRVRIGGLILASKFYGPVSAIGPEVSILSILIGISTPTLTNVTAGVDQQPILNESDIDVTIV